MMLCSCGKAPTTQEVKAPEFSGDSAYQFVAAQVGMGARVPGSAAHEECARYLQNELRRLGAEVEIQQGQMPDYEGKMQQVVNIIAHLGDPAARRVLLCAHWDSRPWADQEEDYENRMQPVTGANDGASGVGVLLEIVRQAASREKVPALDIVLFDCEDMGTPDFYTGKEREDTWCLGSQLWAKTVKEQGLAGKYKYGILLDMVGDPDAVFYREYYSEQFAPNQTEELWRAAAKLGYGGRFRNIGTYPVTDDHYYVNRIAGIPCVDVIHYDSNNGTGFAHWWHTLEDDMRNVSPSTLEIVGKTVLECVGN